MIYIASDHGGFELKNKIMAYLKSKQMDVIDMSPHEFKNDDDYPDYVIPTMQKVLENVANCAILICRNGVGANMLANKFKGIRAGLSWNAEHAKSSRNDDNTNVLSLPADYINEEEALDIVQAWLSTPFSNEERHIRRLNKFKNIGFFQLF